LFPPSGLLQGLLSFLARAARAARCARPGRGPAEERRASLALLIHNCDADCRRRVDLLALLDPLYAAGGCLRRDEVERVWARFLLLAGGGHRLIDPMGVACAFKAKLAAATFFNIGCWRRSAYQRHFASRGG